MAEQHTYNPYTLADIERYLQGKMNAGEMHAMEKAALEDPFLSDAIEGYSRQPFSLSHQHLNEITTSLSAESQNAKVIVMPVKSRKWWRTPAAAVLAALAGIGVFMLIKESTYRNEMAKTTVVVKDTPAAGAIAALPADTAKTGDASTAYADNRSTNPGADKRVLKKAGAVTAPAGNVATNLSVDKESGLKDSLGGALAAVAVKKPAADAAVNSYTLDTTRLTANALVNTQQSNFSTNNIIPPPHGPGYLQNNVTVANVASNKVLQPATGFNKDYFLKTDSTVTASTALHFKAAPGGRGEADKEVNRFIAPPATQPVSWASTEKGRAKGEIAGIHVALKPDPNFDTAVAITYLNNKSRNRTITTDSSLLPQGGWESFRDYVSRQLHKEIDTTGVFDIAGNVELEFTIDDQGIARDIKVTKSLNAESDNEAMDLVKKWPAWITTKKHRKGRVVIQF